MKVHIKHLGLEHEHRVKPGERIEFISSEDRMATADGLTCACGLVKLDYEPAWTTGRLTHGRLVCYRIVPDPDAGER